MTTLDLCTGAGGEALGIEAAGFTSAGAVENDHAACATLRLNRPHWHVFEADIRSVNGRDFRGVDLIAGGVPCPPFSIAGKRLGEADERDLFPEALRIIHEARPSAVLLENVPGFATAKFSEYRTNLIERLNRAGYTADWRVINASDLGVPQLRPRFILVALRKRYAGAFRWPEAPARLTAVGQAIGDLMASRGWPGAEGWRQRASGIAPTLVGGSKKHGGPDLGPTRAKAAWRVYGVDAMGLADEPPGSDFPLDGYPRLTIRMAARLQAFPDDWQFAGGKTAAYRQVGNALPPPVARAVGEAIRDALQRKRSRPAASRPLPHAPTLESGHKYEQVTAAG
jgi:DNA (cytosine-5)-methyltransferase 1